MKALALKYRPQKFDDVVCQEEAKVILENQIKTKQFKQAYLFTGSAGCGKTTSARIFAKEINEGKGKPIEIDGASNNGVDNVRNIIDDCKLKSIDSKYKVYIIDEVHMLSLGAFNALLKVLEEPPKGVVFILCTTDPQKIPNTILSRVQRFDFKKIPTEDIVERLAYILDSENKELDEKITYTDDALWYIAKLADGGMRDAIMRMDTVLGYTNNLSLQKVLQCLGIASYDDMNALLDYILVKQAKGCIKIIDGIYMEGKDLKLFIKDFNRYILDLCKYALTNNFDITMITGDYTKDAQEIVRDYGLDLLVELLDITNNLYNSIKYESSPKASIESELIILCSK